MDIGLEGVFGVFYWQMSENIIEFIIEFSKYLLIHFFVEQHIKWLLEPLFHPLFSC